MASQATTMVTKVTGIALRRPPILRMSCSPAMAWITEPGAEEEQRLEEGVGEQVEHPGDVAGGAHRHEHVAQLADRRVGEHPLDVALSDGDGGGEQGSGGADDGDHRRRHRGQLEQRPGAGHQVDAGGDHGGGMDEGRHRGRALHGIGEPHVQRDLGGLARRPTSSSSVMAVAVPVVSTSGALSKTAPKSSVPKAAKISIRATRNPRSPMRLTTKAFLPAAAADRLLEPEGDEQVRAEPDQLPPDEQHAEAVAEHEDQHRGDEEVEVGEEPTEPGVAVHVAHRVEVDEESDPGDDQRHHRRQRVPQSEASSPAPGSR